MRLFIHKFIRLLILGLALSGCTTMQKIKEEEESLSNLLLVGEHIIVYKKSGQIVDMRYVRIDGTILRGSLFNNGLEAVAIDIKTIEKIEAERINVGRTTAATMGGIILLPLAAIGIGIGLAEK